MALQVIPEWIANLDDEDVSFIKRFLLASGSLKEMAKQYEVTYPTVTRLGKWLQRACRVLTEAQGINANKDYAYRMLLQVTTEEEYAQMIDGLPVDMATKLRLKEIL